MLGVPSALVTIIFLSRGRVRMPSLWAVSKFIKFSCAPVSSRAVRVTGFPFNIILIGIRRESALLLRVIALSWRGGCFNSEVIKNFRIRQSRYLRGPLHLSAMSFPCNQPHRRIHFRPMLGTWAVPTTVWIKHDNLSVYILISIADKKPPMPRCSAAAFCRVLAPVPLCRGCRSLHATELSSRPYIISACGLPRHYLLLEIL